MTPGELRNKRSSERAKSRHAARIATKYAKRAGDEKKVAEIKKESKKETKRITKDRSPKTTEQRRESRNTFISRLNDTLLRGAQSRQDKPGAAQVRAGMSIGAIPSGPAYSRTAPPKSNFLGTLKNYYQGTQEKASAERAKPFRQRIFEGAARAGDPTGIMQKALTGAIGFGMKTPEMYRDITTGPSVGFRDVAREIPSVALSGGIKTAQTIAPALSKFTETTGKVFGEGLAYATDRRVREQYGKGNLDILPTISKETIGSLGKKTAGAMIETALYKMIPSTLKRDILSRGGIGFLQGWGIAVADGLANDRSFDEIMENGKQYAKYGVAGEILGPYIGRLLSSGVGKGKLTKTLTELPGVAKQDVVRTGETTVGKYLKENPPGLTIKKDLSFPNKKSPLHTEARKYSSPEEFVKDIKVRFGGEAQLISPKELELYETTINRKLVDKLKEQIKAGDDSVFLHKDWNGKTPAIRVEEYGYKGHKYKVVDGNHRLLAAQELGIKNVPVNIIGFGDTELPLRVSYKKGLTDVYQKSPSIWKEANKSPFLEQVKAGAKGSSSTIDQIKPPIGGKIQPEVKLSQGRQTYTPDINASSTKSSLGQTKAASTGNIGSRTPKRLPQEAPRSGMPQATPDGLSQNVSYTPDVAQGGVKVKPRGFVETIRQSEKTTPEVSAGIGGKYNPITNKATIEKANQSIAKDFEGAVRRAKTQEHLTTDVQAESLRLIDELQAKGRTQDAIDIVEKMSERATAGGQAEQILAAYNRLTPEGILQTAQRQVEKARKLNPEKFGKLKLTPEDAGKFRKMAEDAKNIPPGEAKDAATREMLDELARIVPTPWARKLTTLWKAGLLTGVKGAIGGNTVGNTAMTVLKKISDVPAAGIDNALALATGNRSKVFTMKGLLGGAWEGLKEGIGNMRKGIGAGSVANKLDYQKTYFGKGILGRAAQKYTDTVFNAYSALDRPFFHSALKNNLYDFAKVEAKNKGLSGKAATDFVENLVKEPTDEILSLATEAAEKVVFQDKNAVGAALSGAKQGLKKYGGSTGEIVSEGLMPFTGVPSSITMAVHNYGPTGAVQGALKAITAAKNGNFDKATQRMLAESLGKGITGTGIVYIGMKLTDSGQMTLGYPKDKGEQALWEAEGKIPYAIKLFGKWRSLNYTGPIMSLLAIGGEVQTAKKEGDSGLTAIGTGALGSGKAILSSSPLQGAQAGMNAITDPQRYGESYMQNQASSIVPTIVKDIAVAGDPLQREVNTVGEALQSKIPGARESLLPKRDLFGKEVPRATSAMGAIFDPFKSSEDKTTPIIAEFRRLQDAGAGPTLSDISKKQKINGEDIELNPKQLDEMEQYVGKRAEELTTQLIESKSYAGLSDEEKQKRINEIFTDVRTEAKIKLLGSDEKIPTRITAHQVYEDLKNAPKEERGNVVKEFAKTQPDKETFDKVMNQAEEYAKNDIAKKAGLDTEKPWMSLNTDERASYIWEKIKDKPSEERKAFIAPLAEQGLVSDTVGKKIIKMKQETEGVKDEEISQAHQEFINSIDKQRYASDPEYKQIVDDEMAKNQTAEQNLSVKYASITGSNINIPQSTLAGKNNNPGNLRYAGQEGASQGQGGFARFDSPQAGYEALKAQIELDKIRGMTIEQFVSKYAPPSENNTSQYIKQFVSKLGKDKATPLQNLDTEAVAQFMAFKESGTQVGGEQIALSPQENRVVEAVGNGTMTPQKVATQLTTYYADLVKTGNEVNEPQVTEIPTGNEEQEMTRTQAWLMGMNDPQGATQTYRLIQTLKLFGDTIQSPQDMNPVNNSPFLSALSNSMNRYYG